MILTLFYIREQPDGHKACVLLGKSYFSDRERVVNARFFRFLAVLPAFTVKTVGLAGDTRFLLRFENVLIASPRSVLSFSPELGILGEWCTTSLSCTYRSFHLSPAQKRKREEDRSRRRRKGRADTKIDRNRGMPVPGYTWTPLFLVEPRRVTAMRKERKEEDY